jgi:TetR/AcrR family transcriptional regulator
MTDISKSEIKIKKAAIFEFAQYGLAGARVDRIAKKAKINKAMIYYYYKSKEKLYESIISEVYTIFFNNLIEGVPKNLKPDELIEFIIKRLFTIINNLDILYFQIFAKEISDGAKYIKKLVLQPVIFPIITTIQGLINKGNKDKIFREINPVYSFIPIIGSVMFFNLVRAMFKGTDMEKVFFSDNYKEIFSDTVFDIYMNGILVKKEGK